MNQVIVFFTIRKYLACSFVLVILTSTASNMEKERKLKAHIGRHVPLRHTASSANFSERNEISR
ncbi:hypothetical protein BDV24DRAFT_124287 [Aspergillus arachidicola]|uniref:Uncharacterized protein n=1 Tax=Aspergillus arachidicola TaxID=656916 RepID=A0A5N6YL17_9EURO|nr:hypothetical protein BDV24DRAFT_124287 [Aspergillus arachidicola]